MTVTCCADIVPAELLVEHKENWICRLKRCSLQDLIALSLPYLCATSASVMWSICLYDPTIKLLVYAALPEKYQNWLSLGLCLLEEFRIWSIALGVIGTTWQVQVISFDLVNEQLITMLRSLRGGLVNTKALHCLKNVEPGKSSSSDSF